MTYNVFGGTLNPTLLCCRLLKLLANEAALVDVHVMSPFSRNLQLFGSRSSRCATPQLTSSNYDRLRIYSKVLCRRTYSALDSQSCQLRDAALYSVLQPAEL